MTQVDWIVVAIAAATYVATAVRAAMAAGRFGRRWPVWLAITLLGTAIPAMIVFYRDAKRKMREMPARVVQPPEEEKQPAPAPQRVTRCPHCGALFGRSEMPPGPVKTCPRCRMRLDEVNLA